MPIKTARQKHKPKGRVIPITFPPDVVESVKREQVRTGASFAEIVRRALRERSERVARA
jgi:hypothetical protein